MTTDPFDRAAIREQYALRYGQRRLGGMAVRAMLPPLIVWTPLFVWHWVAVSPASGLARVLLIVHAFFFASWAASWFFAVWAWFLQRGRPSG